MNNIQAAQEVRRKKIISLVICVTMTIAIVVGVLIWNSNRIAQYSKAMAAFNQQNYTEAISLFGRLNGYQDSSERLQESHYLLGSVYLTSGNYDDAKEEFDQAGSYSDAYTQANESVYQRATAFMNAGDYDEATWDFNSISGYRDAETMAKESQYRKAGSLANARDYDAAYSILSNITGYKDADSIIASLPRNLYLKLGEPITVDNYVDVTLQSIVFKKYTGEMSRCWITADVVVRNLQSTTIDLRYEIDTTQIYAIYDGGTLESGYLSLRDYEEGGFLAWHSSNEPYSLNYPDSLIVRANQIAEKSLVLKPSYIGDNFHFQYDVPTYVFDNGTQVTICFQIGRATFIYSGDIEHEEAYITG